MIIIRIKENSIFSLAQIENVNYIELEIKVPLYSVLYNLASTFFFLLLLLRNNVSFCCCYSPSFHLINIKRIRVN